MGDARGFGRQLVWSLGIGTIVVFLFLIRAFDPLEAISQDARFLIRGYQLASSDVVVVGITQQCIEIIGQQPWNRAVYAQAIRRLAEREAALICLDVFFPNPTTPEQDEALTDAVREAGNVILPVFCPVALRRFEDGPIRRVSLLQSSFPELDAAARGLGHINAPPAGDGKFRSTPLALQYKNSVFFSFGVEAAVQYLNDKRIANGLPPDPAGIYRRMPLTERGEFLINFRGQQATFDFYPFHKLLDDPLPKGFFRERIVLIGHTALGQVNADVVMTPLGEMYGVFVQSTIIDNVLDNSFLTPQSQAQALVVIVLMSVLAGFLFHMLRPVLTVAAWVLSSLAVGVLAIYLFNSQGLVVNTVGPLVTLAANFAVAVTVSFRRSRQVAQRKEGEFSSILESSQLSASESSGRNTPQTLVALIGDTIGADMATLSLPNRPCTWYWVSPAIAGKSAAGTLTPATVRRFENAANTILLGMRQPVLTDSPARTLHLANKPLAVSAFLSMPLIVRNQVVGLLNLYNKRPSPVSPATEFSNDDVQLLAVLAQQTALLLENTRLIDDLEGKNTLLQNAMDQLTAAQQELIREEKLAAVGKMASMIMHDMRGPLTAASCYADMMQDPDTSEVEVKDYSERILQQITRINAMAEEVLDFTRGSKSLVLQRIAVPDYLRELRELLLDELPTDRVSVELDVRFNGEITADREKLSRIFQNLVRNAAEAIDGSGTITLAAAAMGEDRIEFCVADTGRGIPPVVQERLFEPFVTHGKRSGTGLGLAIVKKIVQDHGGDVRAESVEGRGTTFFIQLPLVASPGAG